MPEEEIWGGPADGPYHCGHIPAESISPERWQEWVDSWMRRICAAGDAGWESCAMHWYPDRDDDGRPAP